MPALPLPEPPLSDGVVRLRGFESGDVAALVAEQRAADVGYWLAARARARGRGVATRAVELVAGRAFDTLGLERLELRADRQNHASRALAGRAGFVQVTAPVVQRPECDHLPDLFFARLRG